MKRGGSIPAFRTLRLSMSHTAGNTDHLEPNAEIEAMMDIYTALAVGAWLMVVWGSAIWAAYKNTRPHYLDRSSLDRKPNDPTHDKS